MNKARPLAQADKLVRRDEFERLVFAEVLVPDTLNTYGDYHTKESIRNFAYEFMKRGFIVDVNHDRFDVSASVRIVESFIARSNDPDFIPGSWVIGMYVGDDDIWNKILRGEINGFSYEAMVQFMPVEMEVPYQPVFYGKTNADLNDGHVHRFTVFLDPEGHVVGGGTDVVNGHSHTIRGHTFTELAAGHSHIFNYVQPYGG